MNEIVNQYSFPLDVWNRIFSELPNKGRMLNSRVCKLFQQINNNLPTEFWKNWAKEVIPDTAWVSTQEPIDWKASVIERCEIELSIDNFHETVGTLHGKLGNSNVAKDKWLLAGYVGTFYEIFSLLHGGRDKNLDILKLLEFKMSSSSLTDHFSAEEIGIVYPKELKKINHDDDDEHTGYACRGGIGSAQNCIGDYLKGKRNLIYSGEMVRIPKIRELSLRGNSEDEIEMIALESYECAAAQGYPPAFYNLGKCYEYGFGTGIDPKLAFDWYKGGAAYGHSKATYRLGKCYEMGIGCTIDLIVR